MFVLHRHAITFTLRYYMTIFSTISKINNFIVLRVPNLDFGQYLKM